MNTQTAGIRCSSLKKSEFSDFAKPPNLGKRIIRQSREQTQARRSVIHRALSSVLLVNRKFLAQFHEIQTVALPQEYASEGFPASKECRNRTKAVLQSLFNEGWVPKRIGASLAGGIMLVYPSGNDKTVEVEIENDLLISCVVSDSSSVLSSEVFSTVLDVTRFVKKIHCDS